MIVSLRLFFCKFVCVLFVISVVLLLHFCSLFVYYFWQLFVYFWQLFMQVFTYPKVFFDSWIIDPVRNRSASFSVGLARIGAESCEVSVFEIKSHSLTVNIVEKIAFFPKYKTATKYKTLEQSCERCCFHVNFGKIPEFSSKLRVIYG